MSGAAHFSAEWLALREPADAAARAQSAEALLPRLRAWQLARTAPAATEPWRVIDLGCGLGANLRWLAPRLGGPQQWLVVDHDQTLLRRWDRPAGFTRLADGRLRWDRAPGSAAVDVLRRRLDLAQALSTLPWRQAQLVTASALLDLAGADWLRELARHASQGGAALLFALNVDGRHHWSPPDGGDARVARLFAAHQRRDKGLGPALGAEAAPWLASALRALGYRVWLRRSDWRLAPGSALQQAFIEGMAAAAGEQVPAQARRVDAWRQRRREAARSGSLRVGHLDLLALPGR